MIRLIAAALCLLASAAAALAQNTCPPPMNWKSEADYQKSRAGMQYDMLSLMYSSARTGKTDNGDAQAAVQGRFAANEATLIAKMTKTDYDALTGYLSSAQALTETADGYLSDMEDMLDSGDSAWIDGNDEYAIADYFDAAGWYESSWDWYTLAGGKATSAWSYYNSAGAALTCASGLMDLYLP